MKSQYRGNKTVAKNPTISIDVDDPRVSWDKVALTKSRIGSEIDIIGLDGKSLISGGLNLTAGEIKPDQNQVISKPVTIPGVPKKGVPPLPVDNLLADWGLKDEIVLSFDFDTTNIANAYIDRFIVKVYDSLTEDWHFLRSGFGYEGSTFLNTSSAQQELTLHASDIYSSIDINTIISNITKVAVATADILNIGEYVEADLTEYESPLPQPIFILLEGVDYYTVTLDPPNLIDAISKGFAGVIVEEQITTELIKENVSLTTGWSQAAPLTSNSTIVVYAPDAEHRWVRLKYVNALGNASIYSDIQDVKPDAFQPPNTDPPDQFTEASIVWVGDDLKVTFTLPEENIPARIWVRLRPFINGVESQPNVYSDHYHSVDDPTDFFIRSTDLKLAWSTYYSKFKAYIKSVSDQGVPSASEIVLETGTRSSLLTDIYPTLGVPNSSAPLGIFRVTPSISSYVVDFDLPAGASRLEVYESPTPWTAIPTNDDLVVYSGVSPAIVGTPTDDFEKRYVIVRYYDLYGGHSHYSMEKVGQESGVEVTPIDLGVQSLITYPIKISSNGTIFSGIGEKDDNPRVFFNPDGLFAYDEDGGTPSTQIINSAGAGDFTFITRNAKIAEWSIAEKTIDTGPYQGEYNYIQNDLYVGTNQKKYTGMSSNGPYSFWAGASADLNVDNQAEFSVKPTGEVVANKITINGTAGSNDILIETANFSVTRGGTVEAVDVNVSGELNVTEQSYFDANVNIRNGYLITGEGGFGEGPNVQIGSMGLQALDSEDDPTTKIYSDPQSVTVTNALTGVSAPVSGITLWTKKALFKSQEPGEEAAGGFVISDGVIQSNQILLDSVKEMFVIRSTTAQSKNGIILQASSDTDYSIAVGNLDYFNTPRPEGSPAPIFSVSTTGLMTANNAVVKGTIRATEGFFGTEGGARWEIGTTGITAEGSAVINMGTGGAKITMGTYSLYSDANGFKIYDGTGNVLSITDNIESSGFNRVFLGQAAGSNVVARQVEVAKNAEISGAYGSPAGVGTVGTAQDYRSGGLRNMFTITESEFERVPTAFPNAGSGSVLLVYTP